MYTPEVFQQKRNYINQNPVRSGFVEEPSEYLWGSSFLLANGMFDSDEGVDLVKAVRFYEELLTS